MHFTTQYIELLQIKDTIYFTIYTKVQNGIRYVFYACIVWGSVFGVKRENCCADVRINCVEASRF
jgi:hypothetical protein